MTGAKEMSLLPAEETHPDPKALAGTTAETSVGLVAVIERLAMNPQIDVAKLEKVIELQERILRHEAEAAFNAAFAMMQAEIPTIAERGKTDKTTYATLEDIIAGVRPVLHKYGFALSHETDWPDPKTVKVIGILQHKDGHSRRSVFLSAADNTGSKNAIQALGSTMSYGRRYTAMDLLNITTRHMDDDGRKTGKPEPPEGYGDWLEEMSNVADEGLQRLEKTWAASKAVFQQYAAKHDVEAIKILRAKARKVRA